MRDVLQVRLEAALQAFVAARGGRGVMREVGLGGAAPGALVGRRLRVLWPDDAVWYSGRVRSWAPERGLHEVVYEDGAVEWLDLLRERVRLELQPLEELPRDPSGRWADAPPGGADGAPAPGSGSGDGDGGDGGGGTADGRAAGGGDTGPSPGLLAGESPADPSFTLSSPLKMGLGEPGKPKMDGMFAGAPQNDQTQWQLIEARIDARVNDPGHGGDGGGSLANGHVTHGSGLPGTSSYEELAKDGDTRRPPPEVGPAPSAALSPPPEAPADTGVAWPPGPAGIGGFRQGEVVWASVRGYPPWPAVVLPAEEAACMGLSSGPRKVAKGKAATASLALLFFGTYELGRIKLNMVTPFAAGLDEGFHLRKSRLRMAHRMALREAELYLGEGEVPGEMVLPNGDEGLLGDEDLLADEEAPGEDACEEADGSAGNGDGRIPGERGGARGRRSQGPRKEKPAFLARNFEVAHLGAVHYVHLAYHDERFIFPPGFQSHRKLRNGRGRLLKHTFRIRQGAFAPVFEVEQQGGRTFSDVSASKVIRQMVAASAMPPNRKNVHELFGYSHPEVVPLLQALPGADRLENYCAWLSEKPPVPEPSAQTLKARASAKAAAQQLPPGVAPVHIRLPADHCNVCGEVVEYEDNRMVQCDGCKVMVHMACYGIREPPKGSLWLCNVCELGLEKSPPACVLCPVAGGAMKPTTCGRWVHVLCAMWIPETCIVDTSRMEPVTNLRAVPKARFSLTCQICNTPYGACIQCDSKCYAAYHPFCARASANHRMKATEDRRPGEAEAELRLLSYCSRHSQAVLTPQRPALRRPSEDGGAARRLLEDFRKRKLQESEWAGCARACPVDLRLRRGLREPDAVAASMAKRGVVESLPYVPTGRKRQRPLPPPSSAMVFSRSDCLGPVCSPKVASEAVGRAGPSTPLRRGIKSSAQRFQEMNSTTKFRLACGKSGIHGIGLFCKVPHKKGDLVIEYVGDSVRPTVADERERKCYQGVVGAGTYMFRLNETTVVDATRAGNMAHLINHSCDPNCSSRVFDNGDEAHVAITALRDLHVGEELTYDYRFLGDERLPCNCGTAKCRGEVNWAAAEEPDDGTYVLAPEVELQDDILDSELPADMPRPRRVAVPAVGPESNARAGAGAGEGARGLNI